MTYLEHVAEIARIINERKRGELASMAVLSDHWREHLEAYLDGYQSANPHAGFDDFARSLMVSTTALIRGRHGLPLARKVRILIQLSLSLSMVGIES